MIVFWFSPDFFSFWDFEGGTDPTYKFCSSFHLTKFLVNQLLPMSFFWKSFQVLPNS